MPALFKSNVFLMMIFNDENNFFLVFAFLPHTDDIVVFVLVLFELRSSLDDIYAFMGDDLSNYWFLKMSQMTMILQQCAKALLMAHSRVTW